MNLGIDLHPTTYGSSVMASSTLLSSNPTVYMADASVALGYRDVRYALGFGVQLMVTIGTAALALWLTQPDQPIAPEPNIRLVVTWMVLVAVTACCLAVFLVAVLQQGPMVVLPVALLKAVVCLVLVVVGHGQWLCSFALALSVATVLWLLLVRRQLTFAACMLETASNCLTQFPGSLGMAAVILVLGTAYVVLWGLSFSMRSQMSPGWGAIWIVCCVLMLHWTAEVLRNVVHLTVGGAVAAWYFSEGQAPPSPTPRSLRQSLSTSFGSVCCGSLLPSLAIPVHSALLSLQSATDSMRNCGMLALLLHRLLHSFTPLMQRFNLYAFAHVALYGKPYFQAARDTWTLTMTCGLVRVFNDSLVGTVPTLLSLLAGIFLGGLVELITRSWFISLLCTVEGVIVAGVVFTTCSSAATTLCVCFAEKPSNLQAVDVSLYSQIIEATAESAAAGLVPRTPLR